MPPAAGWTMVANAERGQVALPQDMSHLLGGARQRLAAEAADRAVVAGPERTMWRRREGKGCRGRRLARLLSNGRLRGRAMEMHPLAGRLAHTSPPRSRTH